MPALAPDDAIATELFLGGDGLPLMNLLETARLLSSSQDCEAALVSLSSGLPPDEMASVASSIPDLVLSAEFLTLITATDEFVTTCLAEGSADERVQSHLVGTIARIDQRLLALS